MLGKELALLLDQLAESLSCGQPRRVSNVDLLTHLFLLKPVVTSLAKCMKSCSNSGPPRRRRTSQGGDSNTRH